MKGYIQKFYLVYNKCSKWPLWCSIQPLTRFWKFEMTASRTSWSMEEITKEHLYSVWFRFEYPLFDISPEKIIQKGRVMGPSWPQEVGSVWNDVVSEVASQLIHCVQRCMRRCSVLLEPNIRLNVDNQYVYIIKHFNVCVDAGTVRKLPISISWRKCSPYTLLELKPDQTVTFGISAKASQIPLPVFDRSISESYAY